MYIFASLSHFSFYHRGCSHYGVYEHRITFSGTYGVAQAYVDLPHHILVLPLYPIDIVLGLWGKALRSTSAGQY